MYSCLYSYVEKNKSLYDLQLGFRKHHSTCHALVSITDYIRTTLDKGNFVGALFLDLQKAFNTVNQKILLDKLCIYGIRGKCLEWFQTYLLDRRQLGNVTIQDSDSETLCVSHGVPQGSILGPLLFLLYINDFHMCIRSSLTYHFADDTTILFHSVKEIRKSMSHQLDDILDWLTENRLSLNAKKKKRTSPLSTETKALPHQTNNKD